MPKNKRLEFPDVAALGYDIEEYIKHLVNAQIKI